MPNVAIRGVPVLLAAGREEALRPLLVGTTPMATPLATRLLRGGQHEARLVERGFLRA